MNYEKIYFSIIENRKINKFDGYTENHHIKPRSLGGTDDKDNIVSLSAREHYICHLLLTEIYKNDKYSYSKMLHAFMMMCNMRANNQKRDYKVNSHLYEKYKSEYADIISKKQQGDSNIVYGTKWINNPENKISKRVHKETIVEDGWYYGRVQNWETHYTQKHCIVCNTKGLQSKLSKFCSNDCMKMNREKFNINEYSNEFKQYFKETLSINKSLVLIGKYSTGEYYKQAIALINSDIEMKILYDSVKL